MNPATISSARRWLWPLVLVALAAAVFRFDGPLVDRIHGVHLSGDVRRELETAQQFGDFYSLVLIGLVIWLLDPRRRRVLLSVAASVGAVAVLCTATKLLVGRARPRFHEPGLLWPWGTMDLGGQVGVRHAWEFWGGISSDLWSMPSSHTAFAAALAGALAAHYPRLRWVVVGLTAIVGSARVLFGAHYPSDVLVGAAVGWWGALAGCAAVDRLLGDSGRAASEQSAGLSVQEPVPCVR